MEILISGELILSGFYTVPPGTLFGTPGSQHIIFKGITAMEHLEHMGQLEHF